MKKYIVMTVMILTGTSAMAQYYGGYHGGPRGGGDEAASILSAYTGALFLTSASNQQCNYGCRYNTAETAAIVDAKEDAAAYVESQGSQPAGVRLINAFEIVKSKNADLNLQDQAQTLQLANEILQF